MGQVREWRGNHYRKGRGSECGVTAVQATVCFCLRCIDRASRRASDMEMEMQCTTWVESMKGVFKTQCLVNPRRRHR